MMDGTSHIYCAYSNVDDHFAELSTSHKLKGMTANTRFALSEDYHDDHPQSKTKHTAFVVKLTFIDPPFKNP